MRLISHNSYYKRHDELPFEERCKLNYDHPDAFDNALLIYHLQELKAGRAIDGDLAILAKHGDYCTALGMGEAHIVDAEGSRRRAACMGGMLTVLDGEVRLVATTWEWAEQIDHTRADAAASQSDTTSKELKVSHSLCPPENVCFWGMPGREAYSSPAARLMKMVVRVQKMNA